MEDLQNKRRMSSIAPRFEREFDHLKDLEGLKMTQTRADKLSEKRRDKGDLEGRTSKFDNWTGPDAPPLTDEERIASISNPEVHSGSQEHLFATLEEESQLLGNSLCYQTLKWLYPDEGVELKWVTGRPQKPVLLWRNRYITCTDGFSEITSALAARMKLGPERASALTDGGLQIFIRDSGKSLLWDRSWYEVALEVPPSPRPSLTQGKTLLWNEDSKRRKGNDYYRTQCPRSSSICGNARRSNSSRIL